MSTLDYHIHTIVKDRRRLYTAEIIRMAKETA